MRKLLYAVLALVALVAVAFALALLLVDPRAISEALAEQVEEALGEPVALGEVDLQLFPIPAARVRRLVVGSGPTPLAEVDEIRLQVSLPALLLGRVVLRKLEIRGPRVSLELDESGAPILPGAGGGDDTGASDPGSVPPLAVTSLEIREGAVRAGPWSAENVNVTGSLSLDRGAQLELAADVAGVASLRAVEIAVEDVLAEPLQWSARGRIEGLDLAGVLERLELAVALSGAADAEFSAAGSAGELAAATLSARAREVAFAGDGVAVAGDVGLAATLGERWEIDLGGAEIHVPGLLRKPRGAALSFSGPLGASASLDALGDFVAVLGPNRLRGHLALGEQPAQIELSDSTLELAPLAGWFTGQLRPQAGRVALGSVRLALEPLALTGDLSLEGVEVALEHGSVVISGPVRGDGARLVGSPLDVRIGGQTSTIDASYELASGSIDLHVDLADAQLEPIALALAGSSPLTGTVATRSHVTGPPELAAIRGEGSLEIRDGQLRGFSLMKSVMGELAVLPIVLARTSEKDLSRFDEEEFRRLAMSYRLADGVAHIDDLIVEYRQATVELHGTVGLLDSALALSGRLVLGEELESELSGRSSSGGEKVIPIEGVRGTLSRPRVVLDRSAVTSALATLATSGRARERLEEHLGKEGADVVEDILDQLLRGGRKR